MVGTRRLELLTFPAMPGRSNQPCFYQSIPEWICEISRISIAFRGGVLRAAWNRPHGRRRPTGASSTRIRAVTTIVFVKTLLKVQGCPDIKFACGSALKNV